MDWFFDNFGRDRIIMDWLQRNPCQRENDGNLSTLYDYTLSRRNEGRKDLNDLIIMAFEAGIAFSRATKREPRLPQKENNAKLGE